MRFASAHKTASYLMIGCAFLALVLGGGVPGPLALFGGIALVVSWWWEPPRIRFERWSIVWTIASLAALAYTALSAIATADFLGVGATFLVWLVIAKAFNRRAARDWQQLYLLAFLMLVAGSVLNAELTYGVCFLGFVISSTWALTLFHLRREMEDNLLVKHAADRASERVEVRRILDSRRIVDRRFFAGTGLLSFGVFLCAAVVFLALPRVGIGLFFKAHNGLTFAGFTDGVKLGGHGVIKDDSTVVMRVEVAARFGETEAPPLHWRGASFDHYSAGEWSRSSVAPETEGPVIAHSDTVDTRVIVWRHAHTAGMALDEERLLRQDVWLEPLDSNILFAAGQPRYVEYPHVLRSRRHPLEHNEEVRLEHGSTVHYTVWSELEAPTVDELRVPPTQPLPLGFSAYLQLPEEITPRTRALAAQITQGKANEYDKAVAIADWLDANLSYTLELADPGRQEPVDFFLFDRKKGHCEYFASAFAVLARAAGIPTRTVNGFYGGEWNEYQNYIAVRAGDAHSWDEVYFPDRGWVMFDATPPSDELGRGGTGRLARWGRYLDTLRFQWNKWVIEYDLASQLELLKSVGHALQVAASAVKRALLHAYVLAPIALVFVAWLWRRRRRGPARAHDTGRAAKRSRPTVAQLYDDVSRAYARAGFPRAAGVTPREHAVALAALAAPGAAALGELTELYYGALWGTRTVAEARAAALAASIRDALRTARKTG
ncbi:MAG TPA: DUF3488 and transglutaminase-like domain-containing protein [Kofleriaceae bacterium]|jgi:hypothetical protein